MRAADSPSAALHAVVRGRVQGVFYRATTQREARRLGLSGWVRNRPDGTVELVAEGPRDDCERLIEWCREGPPAARVENVEVAWTEPSGSLAGFEVRY